MIEISRFRGIRKRNRFLERTFTTRERAYCLSHRDSATHFAGTFAGKEAVQKALPKPLAFQDIEIRREKNGKPAVWLKGRRSRSLLISITHTASVATAIALRV